MRVWEEKGKENGKRKKGVKGEKKERKKEERGGTGEKKKEAGK